ncbi:hypothetical protein [Phaeobacter sp. NW0010-22]|uniref:hypothetical protein n=1 Tax=Phaeobacter sp. NW0010-22 TaxID=3135907 RepID=UPI003108ADEC
MITACENICRDYKALSAIVSAIEPLFPLLAAGIGAFAAYKIATVAYAKQKNLDRKAEQIREQRHACVNFVNLTLEVGEKLRPLKTRSANEVNKDIDEIFSAKRQIQKAFAELALLVPESILIEAQDMKEYVWAYFPELIMALKGRDKHGDVIVSDLAEAMNRVMSKREAGLKQQQQKLINAIRSQQF